MNDDDYVEYGCECELDWSCGLHAGQATPEDRLATAWAMDHRSDNERFGF